MKKLFNQKGIALLTVMIAIVIISMLAAMIMSMLVNELKGNNKIEKLAVARYTVEGMIEVERARIYEDVLSIIKEEHEPTTTYYDGRQLPNPMESCTYVNQSHYTLHYDGESGDLKDIFFRDPSQYQLEVTCQTPTPVPFKMKATLQLVAGVENENPSLNYIEISRE
ncbi:type IV pilus modification PilV family protein [Bacillus sp. FJAT-45350]|uniref:type IV pilus modification PilV family protein n=1 Tax=Bacillus sp. FJAT-45350 TaxID=2011014 RepID=UPI000BB6F6C4|nr:type II secretion system protein [Bacillus sp. FJAT-45350]